MKARTGNLSKGERALSALFGLAFLALALRRGNAVLRGLSSVIGSSLLARAAAGHCAMKAAMTGQSSLSEGVSDQWRSLSRRARPGRQGLPGSPVHAAKSEAVDESVAESFPASDPPASRLPDEPPVNAEAKWAAARAAGQ